VNLTLDEWEALKAQAEADAQADDDDADVINEGDAYVEDDDVPDEMPGEYRQ